ncbi:MAG: DNA topoisomerase IB [Pirellulaceae bacterium]
MERSGSHGRRHARTVGLRYCTDSVPGIRRVCSGRQTYFVDVRGKRIRSRTILARIRSLVIPPAWTNVWVAPHQNHHLQATGRDAKGRKQYRYHPRWRESRDATKYGNLIAFAQALPKIRRRVNRDLKKQGLPRDKVLAAVVRLLETTLIRVGNDEYVRQNRSFGLTTMQDRHAHIRGKKIRFRFRGKSGVVHDIDLQSATLAQVVKRCQELPGQELFQYVGDDQRVHDVGSADVNAYLREISGQEISAKDFRTWAGTVLATEALQEFGDYESEAEGKRNIARAIERVAERLRNTPAVCRKCYVHPTVIDAYLDHSLLKTLQRAQRKPRQAGSALDWPEMAVLTLLRSRIKR